MPSPFQFRPRTLESFAPVNGWLQESLYVQQWLGQGPRIKRLSLRFGLETALAPLPPRPLSMPRTGRNERGPGIALELPPAT